MGESLTISLADLRAYLLIHGRSWDTKRTAQDALNAGDEIIRDCILHESSPRRAGIIRWCSGSFGTASLLFTSVPAPKFMASLSLWGSWAGVPC